MPPDTSVAVSGELDQADAAALLATYQVTAGGGAPDGQSPVSDTVAGTTSTLATIGTAMAVRGYVNSGTDQDWYRIDLVAGQQYTFALNGFGRGALQDPILRVADSSGTIVTSDDDSGPLAGSLLTYTPSASGTYYVSAGSYDPPGSAVGGTGQYLLTAAAGSRAYTPIVSSSDIADYLTHSYFEVNGERDHHWNDTLISFNVTALEPERAALARVAFSLWSDVAGLTFEETTGAAQITFDDNQSGAFANTSYDSNGIITSASVNVETSWSGGNDAIDSYTFQTYIHEIGHTLGLGHAGPYNASATYGTDNVYANDSWQYSVMSYMEQDDFGGASRRFTMTPMMADILAVANLYGSATTRTGNTVYGFGSTAGTIYEFSFYTQAPALTIYDSGGTDMLNAAGYSANQIIDIGAGNFCSIGGLSNNVCIYLTSVIENAAGGNGNDTIRGNSAANLLEGNGGNDILDGGNGDDLLRGGAGDDILQGGAGRDTAVYSVSSSGASWSSGGNGAWTVTSSEGTDTLFDMDTLVFADRAVDLMLVEDGVDDILWRDGSGRTGAWILDETGINGGASRTFGTINTSTAIEGDGDFNGDGNLDLLIRESGGALRTLCLDSSGFNGSASRLLASPASSTDFVVGDFNNDGIDDVAWQEASGRFGFWIVDSSGINGSASRTLGSGTNPEIVGSGDFNGDANFDLLWRDSSGRVGTFVLDHTGINGGASRVLGSLASSTDISGIGDFNADGISDLVLQDSAGQVFTWIVDSTGVNGGASRVLMRTSSDIAGTGDFNDDGIDDLLWRDGSNRVGTFVLDQTGINGSASHTIGTLGSGVEIVGLGDVNGNWLV
jgi:serralysin